MDRTKTLAAGAAGVVVVALLVAVLAPGALSAPRSATQPGSVDIADTTIQPQAVGGQTAALQINSTLRHRGNPSPNVAVRLRAIDTESGLLETTQRVEVAELADDREQTVPATLSVAREGGYRIETVVYQNGQRVDTGRQEVRGLAALIPEYARTPIQFADETTLPPLGVSVQEATESQATLDITTQLINRGSVQSDDVEVSVITRQADSNLVADRDTADVATIDPGRTTGTTMTVSVPNNYNYYVDGVLKKDGVVVDTTRTAVNLNPSERIAVNETKRSVELEVSDFERERQPDTDGEQTETAGESGSSTPGFGVPIAVLALLIGGLLARRRTA
ncbi:MAG: PGF-CTERM archaeal protein-sorting signal [Halonotius sp. J07HN4]|nr:MAG: PGF-CTERM archaeal protein-sorting signal [Halonotius sp. J07HN4]